MTKQIRAYLAVLEEFFSAEHSEEELLKMRAELLQRIAFYQHERLIHLIVTSFAMFVSMKECLLSTIHTTTPVIQPATIVVQLEQ